MHEIEIEIGDLFAAMAKLKSVNFTPSDQTSLVDVPINYDISIQDEDGDWCLVTHLITKYDDIRDITFSDGSWVGCGESHRLRTKNQTCAFASELYTGAALQSAKSTVYVVSNEPVMVNGTQTNEIVYDLTVDTASHLYQTSNGIVHHNTAIAEGLAQLIVQNNVPSVLRDSTVFSLDIGNLIAGTRFRGDFEERMKHVLQALSFIDNPILFIDEIHMIMGAGSGSQGGMDVANLLKPALAKGKIRCIGSTTFEEYRKHFEKDRALVRRFHKLDVHEPSIENTKLILRGLRDGYSKYHGVTYTDEALDAAVDLTSRFVQNRFLPDKAIDVMDSAGARQRVKDESKDEIITAEHIQFEVAKIAKIPEQTVKTDERAKLIVLEKAMRDTVFGQDAAITTLTDAVMIARAGLREDNKPSGAYMFVGPSGTGKTELSRQLATVLGVPLIKFDMSEYMEKHSVAKLIGAPPGYVGHGEGGAGSGLLTNEIENNPHCVLLLDEIEKAHPDIFNILLQVMDDGKLTNSNGKTVYFNNVFLIMTSNAGARDAAKAALGFTMQHRNGEEDVAIKATFAPEFRNRLDAIVKFVPLKREHMLQIVDKFTNVMVKTLSNRGISLVFTDEAKGLLADKGYDPAMGARPLGRVITDLVKKPLSREIVFNDLVDGDIVHVTVVDGSIKVTAHKLVPSVIITKTNELESV